MKGNKANRKTMHAKRCDFRFWYYSNSKHESVSAFCQFSKCFAGTAGVGERGGTVTGNPKLEILLKML